MTPQRWGNDDRRYISRGPGHHGPHQGRRGMSSEPTQPVPQWWQQPQGPKKDEGAQRDEGYRDAPEDSQATRQYPTRQGSPAGPTFTPSQETQGLRSDRGGRPPGPAFPSGPAYPANQGFPAAQGYQGPPPARTRRRRRRWPWITLIVVVLVLVGADRAANAYAEDQ